MSFARHPWLAAGLLSLRISRHVDYDVLATRGIIFIVARVRD